MVNRLAALGRSDTAKFQNQFTNKHGIGSFDVIARDIEWKQRCVTQQRTKEEDEKEPKKNGERLVRRLQRFACVWAGQRECDL